MKRSLCLAVLMALSSPACARDSYSFSFHGHHIHIEASPHCRSLSCLSVTVPGVGNWHNGRRDDDDDVTSRDPVPAPSYVAPPASANAAPAQPALAPAPAAPRVQALPPAQPAPAVQAPPAPAVVQQPPQPAPSLAAVPPVPATPAAAPAASAPPPAPATSTAAPSTNAAATPPAQTTPATPPPAAAPPAPAMPAAPPAAATATPPAQTPPPAADAAPAPASAQPVAPAAPASHPTAAVVAISPLGDWQTEARTGSNTGLVRIEACGAALCGYMLDAATNARGETVLVNMKPKTDSNKADGQWSGNVYSRSSGNSYYGTMTLKEANTLRVEACALGQFFCSGNNWTRVVPSSAQPDQVVTSHQASPEPHS